jgi:hypothetical protein
VLKNSGTADPNPPHGESGNFRAFVFSHGNGFIGVNWFSSMERRPRTKARASRSWHIGCSNLRSRTRAQLSRRVR